MKKILFTPLKHNSCTYKTLANYFSGLCHFSNAVFNSEFDFLFVNNVTKNILHLYLQIYL